MTPTRPTTHIQLRHPDRTKKMPRMQKNEYAIAHRTALAVVPTTAPGITLEAYLAAMRTRLPKAKGWDSSKSANWWAMAIKLDLEARGEITRINDTPPQRLVRRRSVRVSRAPSSPGRGSGSAP